MKLKLIFFIPILIIMLFLHIFVLEKIFIFEDKSEINKKNNFITKLVIINSHKENKKTIEKKVIQKKDTKVIKKETFIKQVKDIEKKIEIKKKIDNKIVKKVQVHKVINKPKTIKQDNFVKNKKNIDDVKETIKKVEIEKKIFEVKSNKISNKEQTKNLNKYISYINETILLNKFYPKIAKNMGIEGKCTLKFKILKSGEIKEFVLDKKSDFSVLNKAALNILQKIGRFKAFPSCLQKDELVLKIPIKYILQG